MWLHLSINMYEFVISPWEYLKGISVAVQTTRIQSPGQLLSRDESTSPLSLSSSLHPSTYHPVATCYPTEYYCVHFAPNVEVAGRVGGWAFGGGKVK